MSYTDLRDWMDTVEKLGELKRFSGVHWNLEQGAICDIAMREMKIPPALLFEDIPDHAKGMRSLWGQISSMKRLALTMNLPTEQESVMGFVRQVREKLANMKPIPPVSRRNGPVMENVQKGDEVDVEMFPSPFVHELDGGRYFGTASLVITRDPDEGWVNMGTYRCMLHDKKNVGIYTLPGKHGWIHLQKYKERKEPCPAAVVVGADPALYLAGSMEVPWGMSEYEYAGALKGSAIETVKGPVTGLPLPATAEIVLEGYIPHDDLKQEGDFGEWPGYYISKAKPEPYLRVETAMYRNDPILTVACPARPRHEYTYFRAVFRSALIWDELEKVGIPDVKGVWCHEAGASRFFNVVSIKQRYAGHAQQAGMVACQCHAGAYMNRFTIVVDDDIDPSNDFDVIWALSTRCDPSEDIEILRKSLSAETDPMIRPGTKRYYASRAVIDATKPFDWIDQFPVTAESSPELRAKILKKYGSQLFGEAKRPQRRGRGKR